MSLIEYAKEKGRGAYDYFKWELRYNSIGNWVYYPFWLLMNRERGLDFPFYFNGEKKFVEGKLAVVVEWVNNFVNQHEPERHPGDTSLTLVKRMKYVAKNFAYYSNDTMSNLYFSEKLPARDYQRLKNTFLHYYLFFLGYNTASGVFLVALNNYIFRTRKASLPLVLLASGLTYAMLYCNYRVSYGLMDSVFAFNVRRLGYGHLVHNYNTYYPRNVDFISH